MRIERVRIDEPGDPSVGIQDVTVYIGDHNDWLFDTGMFEPEDGKEAIEEFRGYLRNAFAVYMDNPNVVLCIDGKWEDEPPEVEPDPHPGPEVGIDDVRRSDHWE